MVARSDTQDRPLIIVAAVTGGVAAASAAPGHPLTPEAIVDSALDCARAGASVIHIHARRPDRSTTMDPAAYAGLAREIRARGCDAVLDFSAGDDGGRASHAQRVAVAGAGAEIVSLAGGSFNIGERLYDNNPDFQRSMAAAIAEAGARPEIEIFDSAHLQSLPRLAGAGVSAPFFFQFVMGLPGTLAPDIDLLAWLVKQVPEGSLWSLSAQTGSDVALHAALLDTAIRLGGHIRTGFEDMRLMNDGAPAPDNAALVRQWFMRAHEQGRRVASPAETRRLLGLG
jgi:3-keto-5-aminohexanoate cleavage enzyme